PAAPSPPSPLSPRGSSRAAKAFSVVRRGGAGRPGQMRGVDTAALPSRPVWMNSPHALEHIGGCTAFAIAEEALKKAIEQLGAPRGVDQDASSERHTGRVEPTRPRGRSRRAEQDAHLGMAVPRAKRHAGVGSGVARERREAYRDGGQLPRRSMIPFAAVDFARAPADVTARAVPTGPGCPSAI